VVEDLKKMAGWEHGFISLIGDLAERKAIPFKGRRKIPPMSTNIAAVQQINC
jgi:hypothetical protein